MKKRCDNPYGDLASIVALAKAEGKKELHKCICQSCNTCFENELKRTKYCAICAYERQKESNRRTCERKILAKKANQQDKGI